MKERKCVQDKFYKSVSISYKLFKDNIKKTPILVEDGQALFNPGVYRTESGEYYLFVRTSTHHKNYPSWIRLYKSDDGQNFKKVKEFFIYPEYTIKDYSYGCEDDRCIKLDEWFVHNYTYLLSKDPTNPSPQYLDHYIAISLSKEVEQALFIGFIDIKDNKDGTCFKGEEKIYLIHRPSTWSDPPCMWYGDFNEGFCDSKKIYFNKLKQNKLYDSAPKIKPPVDNKILLPPLENWEVNRIGLGSQIIPYKDNEYLFTYHVCHKFYQYWWSVGTLYEKDGELLINKILPIPLCIPDTPWEMIGDVPKVSFICGLTQNNNTLEAWYGASDTWIMKLEIELDHINTALEKYGIGEDEVKKNIQNYVKKNKDTIGPNKLVDQNWYNQILK